MSLSKAPGLFKQPETEKKEPAKTETANTQSGGFTDEDQFKIETEAAVGSGLFRVIYEPGKIPQVRHWGGLEEDRNKILRSYPTR